MRIDSPLMTNTVATGSFSGSFTGDGTGLTGVGGNPGGSNTQVQFNDNGSFGGSSNLTFDGTNLTVGGKVSATEIVTNVVSQSISFATGSNRFGDEITDTHTFTGSLLVTGSTHSISGNVGIGTTNPGGLLHVSSGTSGDAVVVIESDTDDSDNADNPHIEFRQDGNTIRGKIGLEGTAGQTYSNSRANATYLGSVFQQPVQIITGDTGNVQTAKITIDPNNGSDAFGNVGIGVTYPIPEKLTVAGNISGSGCIRIGNQHTLSGSFSSIAGGTLNSISDNCSTIAGGDTNTINGRSSFIGSGNNNTTNCSFAFIGAGRDNVASNDTGIVAGRSNSLFFTARCSVIGGGESNTISGSSSNVADSSFIGAGSINCINGGIESFIGSGCKNCITGDRTAIVGGSLNTGSGACGFIGGGCGNYVSAGLSSVVGGTNNQITVSSCAFIGGGRNNCINGSGGSTFLGGGEYNCIVSSTNLGHIIVGGSCNVSNNGTTGGGHTIVVGGCKNCTTGNHSAIVGGVQNTGSGACVFIGGGYGNTACMPNSFIGGGELNTINNLSGTGCGDTIAGGVCNTTCGWKFNTIGGGCGNLLKNYYTGTFNYMHSHTIGGGCENTIGPGGGTEYGSTIGGGFKNCICGYGSGAFIGGGLCNLLNGAQSVIGGGISNAMNTVNCAVIGGGTGNTIGGNSTYGVIVGGRLNSICSVVCGGILGGGENCVCHANSFIVGSCLTTSATCYTFMNNACIAGTTRTTTLVETSARKYKECILPLEDQIENIKKLEPVEFQWKKDKTKDIGFIAEDVLKVYPDLIAYEEDGEINGIQYSKLTTVLVKALQQQQEQINELEKEIKVLKEK